MTAPPSSSWGKPYPAIPKMWRAAWTEFTPLLAYDVEIRRVLFSTSAIELLASRYRRAVTVRGIGQSHRGRETSEELGQAREQAPRFGT